MDFLFAQITDNLEPISLTSMVYHLLKDLGHEVRVITPGYTPRLFDILQKAEIDTDDSLNLFDYYQNALGVRELPMAKTSLNLNDESTNSFPPQRSHIMRDKEAIGMVDYFDFFASKPRSVKTFNDNGDVEFSKNYDWRGFLSSETSYGPAENGTEPIEQTIYDLAGDVVMEHQFTSGFPTQFKLANNEKDFPNLQDVFELFVNEMEAEFQPDNNIFVSPAPTIYAAYAKFATGAKNTIIYSDPKRVDLLDKSQLESLTAIIPNVQTIEMHSLPLFVAHPRMGFSMQKNIYPILLGWHNQTAHSAEESFAKVVAELDKKRNIEVQIGGERADVLIYSRPMSAALEQEKVTKRLVIPGDVAVYRDQIDEAWIHVALDEAVQPGILQQAIESGLPVIQILSSHDSQVEKNGQVVLYLDDQESLLQSLEELFSNMNVHDKYRLEISDRAPEFSKAKVAAVWDKVLK